MKSVNVQELLKRLGIKKKNYGATTGSSKGWLKTTGKELESISPIDGKVIATVIQATKKDYEKVAAKAKEAFEKFKMMPAPKRGLIVREIGDALRKYKSDLGALVTLEMGKIAVEGKAKFRK